MFHKSGMGVHDRDDMIEKTKTLSRELALPILIFLIFGTLFSIVSYLRYLSFSQNVLDLGVNASLLYEVKELQFLPSINNPHPIAVNKLIYIPIGILYSLYPKEWIILFYQDYFLAFSGVLIFLISKQYGFSRIVSMVTEILFFIYYPVSGIFWFDFHFMAFFPTLFLVTFYLYRKKSSHWKISAFLAIITDFMAPVIIFLFVLIEMIKKFRKFGFNYKNMGGEILILLVSSIVFLLPFIYYRQNFVSHYVSNVTPIPLYSNVTFKGEFLIRMILPYLFVPIMSLDYLVLALPYVLMVFSNNYLPYENLMFFQYPALYSPIVMISFIVAIKRLTNYVKGKRILNYILIMVLILNAVLFSFYTPVGDLYTSNYDQKAVNPWLTGSMTYYATLQKITPTEQDIKLMQIVNLVPQGSTILIQGNFPEFAQGYRYICPGTNLSGNPPQYIITDPYNYHFAFPISYNGVVQSYYKEVNYLLKSYNYGVFAYYKGDILFKMGYSGNPKIYGNLSYNLSSMNFVNENGTCDAYIPFLTPGNLNIKGIISSSTVVEDNISVKNTDFNWKFKNSVQFNETFFSTSYLVDVNIEINTTHIDKINMEIFQWED